jgi:hypothetical protein
MMALIARPRGKWMKLSRKRFVGGGIKKTAKLKAKQERPEGSSLRVHKPRESKPRSESESESECGGGG